jgi:hypothetical protein
MIATSTTLVVSCGAIPAHFATWRAHFACRSSSADNFSRQHGDSSRGRRSSTHVEDAPEQFSRHRHLGHLENGIAGVADDLGSDLHHLFADGGQRPAFHFVRQGQGIDGGDADFDVSVVRRRNRSWPEPLKRKIVAATFEPGASVAAVARRYEVNANQVLA